MYVPVIHCTHFHITPLTGVTGLCYYQKNQQHMYILIKVSFSNSVLSVQELIVTL
jgi:hypothetical protein